MMNRNYIKGILETDEFPNQNDVRNRLPQLPERGQNFVVYLLFIAAVNSKKSLEAAKGKTLKNRIDKPFFEVCKKLPKAPVGSRKAPFHIISDFEGYNFSAENRYQNIKAGAELCFVILPSQYTQVDTLLCDKTA